MLKLMKYDFRRHFLPFGVCIIFNLILLLANFIGVDSIKTSSIFEDTFGIISIVLLIYASKEISKDFCGDENMLGLVIPVDTAKRFLTKYLMFALLYIGYQISRIPNDIINPSSNYNIVKKIALNYEEYILHDFIGSIFYFTSTVAVISFGLIIANSLIKDRNVVMLLSIFVIFSFFWMSLMINQKIRPEASSPFRNLTYRDITINEEIKVSQRLNYIPFGYSRSFAGFGSPWSGSNHRNGSFQEDMAYSVKYCLSWIIISLAGATMLIKWKDINR